MIYGANMIITFPTVFCCFNRVYFPFVSVSWNHLLMHAFLG